MTTEIKKPIEWQFVDAPVWDAPVRCTIARLAHWRSVLICAGHGGR